MVDRRSPTPTHNTGQFPVWIRGAREVADHLEKASADDVTMSLVAELRKWALVFEGWVSNPDTRPSQADRLPYMGEFMPVYRRGLSRVVELAKASPGGGGWRR